MLYKYVWRSRGFPPCSQSNKKKYAKCPTPLHRYNGYNTCAAILKLKDQTSSNQHIIRMIRLANEKILIDYCMKCVPKRLYLFDLSSCKVFLRWMSCKDGKQLSLSVRFMGTRKQNIVSRVTRAGAEYSFLFVCLVRSLIEMAFV